MANEKGPNIKKKQKCKNCEGKGLLKKGDKVVKCQRCGGTGLRWGLSRELNYHRHSRMRLLAQASDVQLRFEARAMRTPEWRRCALSEQPPH
jgi:hypothetical protein